MGGVAGVEFGGGREAVGGSVAVVAAHVAFAYQGDLSEGGGSGAIAFVAEVAGGDAEFACGERGGSGWGAFVVCVSG